MNTPLRKNKGVTLIELLVALVISGILVAAIYRAFIGQQKTYTVQEQVVDMQQNVRAGINRMMREIRMAGFGKVPMVLPVTIGGKSYTDVVNPDYPVAGSVTILSGICFYYINGSGEKEIVSTTEVPVSNQIKVNSLTDSQGNTLFDLGNRNYVSIGGVESYTITNIAGTTLTLAIPGGKLTYNHRVGTPVFGIRAVSYQVGMVDGKPTLLRDENSGLGGQPQVDNIENLQFGYLDANGNPTANPADIRIVRVTLRARTNDSDPEYKSDGGYRKRVIASNIHLRNMGLEI
jgi:prepilin-type N-terminal cleavage/methylation domain-containing protein